MDLRTSKDYRVEIVSPAGNIEKLKFAVKYGADAVYFGCDRFNLRDKTTNFSLDDIKKGIEICKKEAVKSIFLLNSFLHEKDINDAREYIGKIKRFDFDAVMVSDPGMLLLLKEADIKSEIHLSTQMSTLNHLAIKFWNEMGIKRIVLARETTLDEIKSIREHTDVEIEIFVHGSLCVSYSGRCLLSRFLSGRDANLGNCSHPCRWNYSLIEEKRQGNHMEIVEYAKGTEIIASKDLCLIEKLNDYIEAGINAFKIEGRMKSLYYTANTTRIYKHATQTLTTEPNNNDYLSFWLEELDLVSHRPYTNDPFNEFGDSGFTKIPYIKKVLFLGYKLSSGENETEASVKIFNPIYVNEVIDAIFPIKRKTIKDSTFHVKKIIYDGEAVEMAQPGKIYLIKFDKPVCNYAIFRRKL